jgi:hypothetical protein
LTLFEVSDADLADDSGIQTLIAEVDITTDNASLCTDAGGTYDVVNDSCSVDITSDNAAAERAGCVATGGTWESGTCTAGSAYPCAIGAMCSASAAEYPNDLPYYTNNYVGHTAASSGCDSTYWNYFMCLEIYEVQLNPNFLSACE